jgi:hypothetical protein
MVAMLPADNRIGAEGVKHVSGALKLNSTLQLAINNKSVFF